MKTLIAAAISMSLLVGAVSPAHADNRDNDRPQWRDDSRHEQYNRNDRDDRYERRDHRYERRDHRRDERAAYHEGRRDQPRYDAGRYEAPRGYYAHSWRRGDRLPPAYYSSRYVVRDYGAYHLYAPPRGHHWVRVNDDVLLTAIATGAVVAVVGGLFH